MAAVDRAPFTGWSTEIELTVRVRVEAEPIDAYFEGLMGREPWHLAAAALFCAPEDPERIDGFADMRGDVTVLDIDRGLFDDSGEET